MPSDKEWVMAQKKKKQTDVIGKLTTAGEDALHKLAEMPGSNKVLDAANVVRERLEDLQQRVRSLDPLERRVAELERRLDELAGPSRSKTRGKPAASKTTRPKTSGSTTSSAKKTPAKKSSAPK